MDRNNKNPIKYSLKKFFEKIRRITQRILPEIKEVKQPPSIQKLTEMDKKLVFSLSKTRLPSWEQFQYIPKYLSPKERLIIRVILFVIIVCLIFLGVKFYQRHFTALPKKGGSYTEALVGQPKYVNPVLAQANDVDRDISHLIFSGLFEYNEKQELVPDLASSYTISDDKKTYTIVLKPNIKWHNGNALLVDDVLFTVELIHDSEYNSPLLSSLKGVGVEKVDEQTIKFTLKEPFAPFLSNLTFGILPAHLWQDTNPTNFALAEYNIKPIGSGPFKFKSLTKDKSGNVKSFTLERNNDYYGQKPYLDKINFKFYPDFTTALEAVNNKSVEGISFIPKDSKPTADKIKSLKKYYLPLPQYTAIFFNQKNKLLKEKDVRLALAYAVDKKKILAEALDNDGYIVNAPILKGFLGYNPAIQGEEYNITKAKETLDKAGWKMPEGGSVRKKGEAELKFSMTTVDRPEYTQTANILAEAWKSIGVSVELKIMNSQRVDKEVIKPRNYEAFLYGEIIGFDPDPLPFWHSSQALAGGLNLSNYSNKEVDKLLEEARQTINSDERAKKYQDFQAIIGRDIPAIFLYSPNYLYGVDKKVKGIAVERITMPSDRFNGIEGWYIKTKIRWK